MTTLVLALRHPKLKALHAFWLQQCAGAKLPMAADLQPADLRPWLDNLVVMEVGEGDDFVYAYYSQAFAKAFGEDRVGQSIDDLPAEQAEILRAEYAQLQADRLPLSRVYTARFDDADRTWERLVLPLFAETGEVEKLLVAAYELTE